MTDEEFNRHFGRLMKSCKPGAYSAERITLINAEVRHAQAHHFERVVNHFIGEGMAPTLTQIREQMAKERERAHFRDRDQNRRTAEAFMRSLAPEEVQHAAGEIRRRIKGQMSDEEWASFQRLFGRVG